MGMKQTPHPPDAPRPSSALIPASRRERSRLAKPGYSLSNLIRVFAIVVLEFASADSALGYRPFDSTDAAVASPGEFELEFGPLS